MAKLAIFALAVAKAQGATVAERAAAATGALTTAATGRQQVGASTTTDTGNNSILPPGVRPGSPEAAAYWASRFPSQVR